MSAELRTLLRDTEPATVADLDVDRVVRRGTRRRRAKRSGAAFAVAALLSVGSVAVLDGGPTDRIEVAPLDETVEPVPAEAWTPLPPAPMGPRVGATVATAGDLVAFIGGETDEQVTVGDTVHGSYWANDGAIYDAASEGWRIVPPAPLPIRSHGNVVLGERHLFLVGGVLLDPVPGGGVPASRSETTLDTVRFDLVTSTWRRLDAPDVAPRIPDVVSWDGERLVVWGGSSWDEEATAYLDGATWTETDGWSTIPAAPLEPRSGTASAVVGDRIVVWGGTRAQDDTRPEDLFADGAVYDLTEGTWTMLPDGPLSARWIGHDELPHRANVRIDGDRVLIAGGATTGTGQRLDGAWLDLRTGTWTAISPAPDAARFVTAHAGGLLAVDDEVTDTDPYVTLWRYDEDRDTWDRTDTRLRTDLRVHAVSDERIVVSSTGDDGRWQDSPRLGIWEAGEPHLRHASPPLSGRMHASVSPLPDGALVWGGRLVEPVGDEGVESRPGQDGARLDLG